MPARLNTRHQEAVRNLIRAQRIVARLQQFVFGKKSQHGNVVVMTPTQVKAAEVLLRKVLPDLATIEVSGELNHNYIARVPNVSENAEEWTRQHAPTPTPTIQ